MSALTRLTSLLLGFILIITACNTATPPPQASTSLIVPPIPALAPAYQQFSINTEKDTTLSIASGTQITIRANSLVDATGTPVKGEAIIKYREYHDAASVVLSGIPMNYYSNGQEQHFQTAGMFDIAGEQNGAALAIKEGSGIQVDLASFADEDDYSFFALNEETGWQFVDHVPSSPNPQRDILDKEIKSITQKMGSSNSPYFVFNYDGVLDISFDSNPLSAANRANSKVRRKFQAYNIDAYKSSLYQYIKYETSHYPADMLIWKNVGRRFPNWARYKKCAMSIKLLQDKTYEITAKLDGKEFVGKIEILVPLKYLFDYTPERWKNNIATVLKDISSKEEKYREELERLRLRREQQAAVLRSFEIAGFGIYNYDRLFKEENKIEIVADFKAKGIQDLDWVICLPEDGKTVIKYPKNMWAKVVLLPDNKAKFISIMPDKKVAVYSSKAYQTLDFETLRNQEKPQVDFELVTVIKQLESEADLKALIQDTDA